MIRRLSGEVSVLLLLAAALLLFAIVLYPYHTQAAINSQINFQGKLINTDGTNVTNGTYNLQFKIYSGGDGVVGGGDETLLWTEEWLRNNTQGVTVTDGIFNTRLGAVTALPGSVDFNNSTLWLSINIGNTNATCTPFSSCSGDGEMSPMVRFTAAPYAFNSDTLDGIDSASFVKLAQGAQTDTSITQPSIYINKNNVSGSPNILQLQKASSDVFVIDNTGNITATGTYNTNTFSSSTLQFGAGGTATVDSASGQALQIGTGANAHNITVGNVTSTSALTLQSGSGNINLSPAAGADVVFSAGAGSNLQVSASAAPTVDIVAVSNSGQASATSGVDGLVVTFGSSNASGDALHFIPSYAGGGTDLLTYNVLEVEAFSPTNGAGTDTVNGLVFGNLTDPGATITSNALNIGTGWDYELTLADATPGLRFSATDNTADFKIYDNCSATCANGGTTPNNLFEFKDLSTNFGGLALAGAFADINSYFGEEFTNARMAANCTADVIQGRGAGSLAGCTANTGVISVDETQGGTANCTISTPAEAIGGFERIQADDGNNTASCAEFIGSSTAGDAQLIFNSDNLPVVQMKVRPAATDATNGRLRYFVGIGNLGVAGTGTATAGQTNMDTTNDSGIYFSNCTAPNTPTCQATTWQVTIHNSALGGTKLSTADCGVTINTTKFAYMRIEVAVGGATPTVRAYVDGDVSDGINPTLCPAFGTTIDISSLAWGWFADVVSVDPSNTALNFDIDYVRIWQDDPAMSPARTEPPVQAAGADESAGQAVVPAVPDTNDESTPVDMAAFQPGSGDSSLDLTVHGILTAQGGLVVGGPAEFHGNSTFYKFVSFVEKTLFKNDVTFEGRTTFNNDAGGFAVIKKGQDQVHVAFKKEYSAPPVVTVSVKNGLFVPYSYKDLGGKGFTIVLPQVADSDVEFAWSALSIADPQTSGASP